MGHLGGQTEGCGMSSGVECTDRDSVRSRQVPDQALELQKVPTWPPLRQYDCFNCNILRVWAEALVPGANEHANWCCLAPPDDTFRHLVQTLTEQLPGAYTALPNSFF